MNEAQAIGWLGRKVGWGFAPGQLDQWLDDGVETVVDRLVDPDAHGVETRDEDYAEVLERYAADRNASAIANGVTRWIDQAQTSPRSLETFMEFFWMDWFAVSVRSVRPPTLMFGYVNLLGRHGLGNFGDLIHDVTIDGAMLVFLDGATSTAGNPNENYGRELLELYTVGVGNFTEEDVQAAAAALTGWSVRRVNPVPRFRARLHDDRPQTLVGVDGVNDVETVVDAVVNHPATAPRVVDRLALAILGKGYDTSRVAPLTEAFADDLELRPVVRGLIEIGIDGGAQPSILEPLAWMTLARKFTGTRLRPAALRSYFRAAGQIPLLPPNVGGYPEPDAYLSTSATIARVNMASELAIGARSAAVDASQDVDELARSLGLVDGFSATTREAIDGLPAGSDRIAAALASPDLLVA